MKFNAIIFDLDGVLCYTDKYHYLAWKNIADSEGIYFDEQINKRLRGVSRMDSLEIILERAKKQYSAEEKQALAEEKNRYYVELLNEMSPECIPDDAVQTLQELKNLGVKTAIGSSSKNTKLILKNLGLEYFFDGVSDGTMISNSKPDPEVFLKAAVILHEKPNSCLVVEDAVAGIEAAVCGGFYSAALGDAQNHPKATYKINKLSDLIKIVNGK